MKKCPRIPGWALSCAVLLALGGCKTIHHLTRSHSCNKPQPYQQARSIPPLKVPQGLDAPDTAHALDVPQLNVPAPPPRTLKDPCLSAPPAFNVPQPNARIGE
jgi:uncharacterized lipoprotein